MKNKVNYILFFCFFSAFIFSSAIGFAYDNKTLPAHSFNGLTIEKPLEIYDDFFIQSSNVFIVSVSEQVLLYFCILSFLLFGLTVAEKSQLSTHNTLHVFQKLAVILFPFHSFW
jgi:hypothetical protein